MVVRGARQQHHKAAVRPQPDGGAIVAYETGERIEVVRLDGDGSELYRYSALGSDPSIAATADGSAFVSFVGTDEALGLPRRLVPVVIELSASGEVLRAAQLACSGTAIVIDTEDGQPMLVGAFQERATLGDHVKEIVAGEITVGSIF